MIVGIQVEIIGYYGNIPEMMIVMAILMMMVIVLMVGVKVVAIAE